MDMNLEIIEFIMDKTGATEAEAQEALDNNNGVVLNAIRDIIASRKVARDNVDPKSVSATVSENSTQLFTHRIKCLSCGSEYGKKNK